jgi:hypothetical protein
VASLLDPFRLSTLPALGPYLIERAQHQPHLLATLEAGDYTQGAALGVATLGTLLDEWLADGQRELDLTNEATDAYKYLAIHAHLAAVQTFRELLD